MGSSRNLIEYYLTKNLTNGQLELDYLSETIDVGDVLVANLFVMGCDEEPIQALLDTSYHRKFFHAVGVELSNRLEIADFDFPWLLNHYHKLKGLKEEDLLRKAQQHHDPPEEMDKTAIEKAFAIQYECKKMLLKAIKELDNTAISAEEQSILIEHACSSTGIVNRDSNLKLLRTSIVSDALLPLVSALEKVAAIESKWASDENTQDNGCREALGVLARCGYSTYGILEEVADSNKN